MSLLLQKNRKHISISTIVYFKMQHLNCVSYTKLADGKLEKNSARAYIMQ
jgi:hypothetical protein